MLQHSSADDLEYSEFHVDDLIKLADFCCFLAHAQVADRFLII